MTDSTPPESKVGEVSSDEDAEKYLENVKLAKQLLHEEECKKEEAVELLIEASKACNKEATEMLAKCLKNGEGITNENREAVEWCVDTPEAEKRLKHAMTELFMSLKKEGKDKISAQDIKDALKETKGKEESLTSSGDGKQRQEELGLMSVLTSVMSIGGKDELSLREFMDTTMSYAKGGVPQMEILLDKDEMEKYNKASMIEKVLNYPHQTFEYFKFTALSTISKRGISWLKSLVPTAQIQTLLLLYLYHQLSAKVLWFIVPLVIFYIAMTGLIIFSLQMFHGRASLKKLKNFSHLLRKFDPRIDEKEAERKFIWKSIAPYIWFFVFILITVAVYPLCDKSWIPCSELSIISLFFTVSALRGLPDEYDDFTLYTLGLKVLTMVLHSFNDIKGLWVLSRPLLIIPLPYKLEMHISIPAILHVAILVMLIIMAGRHSWKGIYKVLIPHLVCLLWWQMFTELFVHTTWQSLARASIGWVIFITMLPLVFVYIVGVFLVNFFQWFLVLDLAMKLAVTAIAIGASSVIVLYSNLEIPQDVRKRRKQLLVVVAFVVFCLLGPIFYVNYVPAKKGGHRGIKLTWKQYDALCGPTAHKDHTEAALQGMCADFEGETVTWKGTVTSVKVAKVDNRFRTLVTAMPKVFRPTLRCLLGGEAEKDKQGDQKASSSTFGWLFKHKSSTGCNLKSFDRYTFLVGVEFISVEGSLAATVTVSHKYYQTMMKLNKGTNITVRATLNDGLGSGLITMSLRRLFIDGAPVKAEIAVEKEDLYAGVKQAGRYSVQFFFSPLVNQQGSFDYDEDDDDDDDDDGDGDTDEEKTDTATAINGKNKS